MKPSLTCLLLALFVTPSLHADSGAPPETPSTFRLISSVGSYGGLFYDRIVDGKNQPVSVSLDQTLSPPYILPDGPVLELYRIIPPPAGSPPGNTDTRQTVLTAEIPAHRATVIVVTSPVSKNKLEPIRARVISDDPATHQAGTLHAINCSRYDSMVTIDDHKAILTTGTNAFIKEGSERVLFQVSVKKGNGWDPAFRGERLLNASLRGYLFIFDYTAEPNYGSDAPPAPVLARIFFEVSPEITAK